MTANCGNHISNGLPPAPNEVLDKGRAWLWASAKAGIAKRRAPSATPDEGWIDAIYPSVIVISQGPLRS